MVQHVESLLKIFQSLQLNLSSKTDPSTDMKTEQNTSDVNPFNVCANNEVYPDDTNTRKTKKRNRKNVAEVDSNAENPKQDCLQMKIGL